MWLMYFIEGVIDYILSPFTKIYALLEGESARKFSREHQVVTLVFKGFRQSNPTKIDIQKYEDIFKNIKLSDVYLEKNKDTNKEEYCVELQMSLIELENKQFIPIKVVKYPIVLASIYMAILIMLFNKFELSYFSSICYIVCFILLYLILSKGYVRVFKLKGNFIQDQELYDALAYYVEILFQSSKLLNNKK